jgi:hypothetical protein
VEKFPGKGLLILKFNAALRISLRQRPLALRRVADRLIDRAEEGDLHYIRELIDRLDGRPTQAIDRHDVVITQLSDEELVLIATGGRTEVTDAELHLIASGGRCEDEMKAIPPPPSKDLA